MRKSKSLLTAALLLATALLHAQDNKGSIKGKLVDSSGKQVLSLATITVFKAADTSIITYRLSDPQGEFKVPGIPLNIDCRAVITFSGFRVMRKEFRLTPEEPNLDFGPIRMTSDTSSLDEVLVIAERPPVVVKKDTIEFNASAFSTLPTALVEDLLKKLPGVNVDGEGNITVNGRKVNRILVDGREFFGNDPKMASRNLPANIIDKVQVAEDKDERELNPDKPAGDIGQVINLKLKKGIKQGWFGKAYAGAGTDDRYEAGGIVNLFRDTLQVSILGFTNNLNRAGFGFTDLRQLGGFDRSGINEMAVYSGGGLSLNGISFGGTGQGINTSSGAGFNLNHVFGKALVLNTQYFYGQTRNDITSLNRSQQFLGDTVLTTNTTNDEVSQSFSHRIGFGLKGQIDSLTRYEFRPGLNIMNTNGLGHSLTDNTRNFGGLLNKSLNSKNNSGKNIQYSHDLTFFKNFKKKGRSFTLSNWINTTDNNNDQVNEAMNAFFINGFSDTTYLEQLRGRTQNNLSANLNITYTEPLGKQTSMRFGYQGNYTLNKDKIETFTKAANGKYEEPDPDLTNDLRRKSWRNSFFTAFVWRYKQLSLTATGNFVKLDIYNDFLKSANSVNQHFSYLLPGLGINWRGLNLNYSVNVQPPQITDVQPTPDNTDPLYVNEGNPDLEPTKHHSIYLNYYKNIAAKSLNIYAYVNGSFREDGVVRSRVVTPEGVQITKPVNIDGQHSFYSNFSISKQYKTINNLQLSLTGGYFINYTRNYLLINARRGYVKTLNGGPQASVGFNWQDKIEYNLSYSYTFSHSSYESSDFTGLDVITHSATNELIIRWPKNIVWEATLNYRYNSNAAPGIQKSVPLLNGGIIYQFLKDQRANLKLSVFDLLDQNVGVYRETRENMIVDRQINILKRYYLLTFTYNIRNFQGGKVGGRERFFLF